jgi:hypothetical protein
MNCKNQPGPKPGGVFLLNMGDKYDLGMDVMGEMTEKYHW